MILAIDAMGGDYAPKVPVEATLTMARLRTDVHWLLFGAENQISACISGAMPGNVEIVHSPDAIDAGEEPVKAVRRKRESSLVKAAAAVKAGTADAMVSAGNTGALVAAGLLILSRLEGIQRPALAPVLPTFDGSGVLLLDAGATMDASAENLLQFARMGVTYSQYVLGTDNPRLGLLNVGSEAGKGNQLTKAAQELLAGAGLNFVGNVEARELLAGDCDVVVCDGFVGNVVLKLIEGVGLGIFAALKDDLSHANVLGKVGAGLVKPELRKFRDKFDYAEYGGAPFLGVAGGCIKAHGSSNHRAWQRALEQAIRFVDENLLERMAKTIAKA